MLRFSSELNRQHHKINFSYRLHLDQVQRELAGKTNFSKEHCQALESATSLKLFHNLELHLLYIDPMVKPGKKMAGKLSRPSFVKVVRLRLLLLLEGEVSISK